MIRDGTKEGSQEDVARICSLRKIGTGELVTCPHRHLWALSSGKYRRLLLYCIISGEHAQRCIFRHSADAGGHRRLGLKLDYSRILF